MVNHLAQTKENRLEELNTLISIVNQFIKFYNMQLRNKADGWQRQLSNRNLAILKEIKDKLDYQAGPKRLAIYQNTMQLPTDYKSGNISKEEITDNLCKITALQWMDGSYAWLLKIVQCSPYISYHDDLTWFKFGTIGELVDIGLGIKNNTIYEEYLPVQIKYVEKLYNSFFSNEKYIDEFSLIKSILDLIKKKKFMEANILLMSLIEGIVKKFCCSVYMLQNSKVSMEQAEDYIYNKFHSLEHLIKKADWKFDIEVTYADIRVHYSHVEHSVIEECFSKMKNHEQSQRKVVKITENQLSYLKKVEQYKDKFNDETVKLKMTNNLKQVKKLLPNFIGKDYNKTKISISIYFDFLCRQFKDDRNNIIHGKYGFFNTQFKSLIYLNALETVINKIQKYNEVYSLKNNVI